MLTLDFILYVFKISVTELTKLSAVCRPFYISPSEIKCIFVAKSNQVIANQIPATCFTPNDNERIAKSLK